MEEELRRLGIPNEEHAAEGRALLSGSSFIETGVQEDVFNRSRNTANSHQLRIIGSTEEIPIREDSRRRDLHSHQPREDRSYRDRGTKTRTSR